MTKTQASKENLIASLNSELINVEDGQLFYRNMLYNM